MAGQSREESMKEDKELDVSHLVEVTKKMGRPQLRERDCIKVDGDPAGFEVAQNRLADMVRGRPSRPSKD